MLQLIVEAVLRTAPISWTVSASTSAPRMQFYSHTRPANISFHQKHINRHAYSHAKAAHCYSYFIVLRHHIGTFIQSLFASFHVV